MEKLNIEATICEIGSQFYHVKLHSIPRIGELIQLLSFSEEHIGPEPVTNQYEVVKVLHDVYEITDQEPHLKEGKHEVFIYVKPASEKFFH